METADAREVEVTIPSRMTMFHSVQSVSEHAMSRMFDPLACSEIARLEEEVGELKRKVYELGVFRIEMQSYRKVTESLAIELGVLHKAMPFVGTTADAQKAINATASVFRIPIDKLMSKDRTPEVAYARMACMYICRESLGMGLKAIARLFNRDHGTALYGLKKVAAMLRTSETFKKKVSEVCNAVEVKCI